jgi:hypothetical protein
LRPARLRPIPAAKGGRLPLSTAAVTEPAIGMQESVIDMKNSELFVSVPDPQSRDAHRREAARIRELVASATTSVMKRHLEDRARAHEWLAGRAAEIPG